MATGRYVLPASDAARESARPMAGNLVPLQAEDGSLQFPVDKSFRLLLGGSMLSMLGSRLTSIAYPMLVLYLTRSAAMAGVAVFAATMPSIFAYLPAGALVDRWNPRWTILISESCRGVAIGAVVFLLVVNRPYVWVIIGAAVCEGVLGGFSSLAERRVVRVIVPADDVPAAQVSLETRTHIVVLVG